MRICDLQSGRIHITRAAKSLQEQWEATCEHWHDGNQRDFERNHLQPIAPQITLMLSAVHPLSQAERDCVDEGEQEF